MDVEDRADLGMLAVDHPVLDRVHRHAPWLDAGRNAQHDDVALGVVALDEQDVAADLTQRRLVDTARAHPELGAGPARGRRAPSADVAVAQATDAVQQLDVAEITRGEDLLDRERRGQQVEGAEMGAGALDLTRVLVAVPQLGTRLRDFTKVGSRAARSRR